MAASKTTARSELDRLRGVVTARTRAIDEIDAERQRALSAVEVVRQQQREFYASQEPGAKPAQADEQRHTAAVKDAQREAEAPWDARKEGARLAIEHARGEVAAFDVESFERLAAELLPPSMQAQARLAAACDELEQALEAWSAVRFEWARITVAVGIPPDELPDLDQAPIQAALPDEVEIPAPRPLVGGRPMLATAAAGRRWEGRVMDANGNNWPARVGGPSPNVATSNHGACGGCGQPVLQREHSSDGVAMVFDEIRQSYAPWHPECARLARGAQVGCLLPTPPRKRWRATEV